MADYRAHSSGSPFARPLPQRTVFWYRRLGRMCNRSAHSNVPGGWGWWWSRWPFPLPAPTGYWRPRHTATRQVPGRAALVCPLNMPLLLPHSLSSTTLGWALDASIQGPLLGAGVLGLTAAAGGLHLGPALAKPAGIRRLARRAVEKRALVLTYDDGPGPETTSKLLDLLGEFGARATFFPSGQRLAGHGDVLARLVDAGHEIGCHGFDHLHAWKVAPGAAAEDYRRGAREIERLTGRPPSSFRPPFGKAVFASWRAARREGVPLAWWTDDSGDSFPELPAESPAMAALERGGGVALMHDLDRSEPRNRFVLEVTRALLEGAAVRGMTVLTQGELG